MQRYGVAIGLPVTLACFLAFLSCTRFFIANNQKLSIGLTIDLVFSVPLLHLLLSKRNNNLKYSTALFFTAGVLVASIIVPKNDQFLLRQIKFWVIPVIEFCGIFYFVVKTKKTLARYKAAERVKGDFYTTFKGVVTEILPKSLASVVAGEISAFYYGFFNWRKPVFDDRNFSYHKKTGTMALIGVFIFMILVETTVFHLVLAKWSTKAAWILSAVSLYAAMQVFGIARSICSRPIQIIEQKLIVRYGILAEATLDLNDILSVAMVEKPTAITEGYQCLSPLKKIEAPDIIIRLKETCHIEGLYGSKKPFDILLINVDEKAGFIECMQQLIKD